MDEKKVTMEDGTLAKLHDLETLKDFFKEKFPDGITVQMPDEALVDLKEYDEMKITGDFHQLGLTEFWGKINNTKGYLEYTGEGILAAEMRFTPEDYGLIMPEDTYAIMDDELAVTELDWGERSATAFAHIHREDTRDMTVEITKNVESLRCLYIEGRPFAEVMKAVSKSGVTDEQELKQLLKLQDLYEKGGQESVIPQCITDLVYQAIGKYGLRHDDCAPQKQYWMAAHVLLAKANVLDTPRFNMEARFINAAEAKKIVDDINRTAVSHNPQNPSAIAVREGDKVVVSVSSDLPEQQMDIARLLMDNRACLNHEQKPYRDIRFKEMKYLMLDNGEMMTGWQNLENLHRGHEYTLASADIGGDISRKILKKEKGNAAWMNLFTATEELPSFAEGNDRWRVAHFMTQQEMKDAAALKKVSFMEKDKDTVYITASTGIGKLTGKRLNPDDTRRYIQAKKNNDGTLPNLAEHFFAQAYYKEEIKQEMDRIRKCHAKEEASIKRQQVLWNRITGAELYGKVNDLHVRCCIDGKWQEGRPVKGYEETLRFLKDGARTLGKDFLHYNNLLHESIRHGMAFNTFQDVLDGQTQQHQRTRGMKR